MNDTNQKLPVDDIEALLPWYAAGTLDAQETDQVNAALAADAELSRHLDLVREEMSEAIALNESLGVPSSRVMEKLFTAIDRERRVARGPAAQGGFGSWLADLLTPRAFAFGAGAAALLIVLEAGVIAKLATQDHVAPPSFQPTSVPSAGTRGIEFGVFALVRFSPQATIADVTRFLDSRDAAIVDGPRPGGGGPGSLYRVRIARHYVPREELERLVKDFQSGSNVVAMAIPTE